MNKQEKERIRELAARLRDASKELNWIIRNSQDVESWRLSLITEARIIRSIGDDTETIGRS